MHKVLAPAGLVTGDARILCMFFCNVRVKDFSEMDPGMGMLRSNTLKSP